MPEDQPEGIKPFKQLTIIGFGLIGSSLARGVRAAGLAEIIYCADINQAVCDKALALNLADMASTNIIEAVKNADMVLLTTPVGLMGEVVKSFASLLKPHTIITDAGSVKQAVVDAVTPLLPYPEMFVPGHPIAGAEHSGPEHGRADLFQDRWVILTPKAWTDRDALARVKAMWQCCGAKIEEMTPEEHDRKLAITSHIPHLIAYTIVATAEDLGENMESEVLSYSAGGFRDFTRIAGSDPTMWRDIFLNNRPAVLEMLQRLTEDLTLLQRAIRWGDGDALYDFFNRAQAIRRSIHQEKK
ncbi:MAG: prephenate/arogenate dehydrogenase family protein [Alphaproteobacteria bacterium]